MGFYVYEHWRLDRNECFYVGKGSRKRAWSMFKRSVEHCGILAETAIDIHIVASGLSEKRSFELEQERVAFWRALGITLVNKTNGGDGAWGCKITPSTLAKRAATLKARGGIVVSEERRARIVATMTGKEVPEERRIRISAALKGRSPSEQHRVKLSAVQKGRVFTPEHREKATAALRSPETRAKLSAAARAREAAKAERGVVISEETRAKLSAAQKLRHAEGRGAKMSEETKAKISATKRAARKA